MTADEASQLADILKARFDAQVEFEEAANGRYRFAVVTERFHDVPHLDRQDAIWKVVNEVLPRGGTLGISLILAFDPTDMARTE